MLRQRIGIVIARITEFLGEVVARVMPWLFLALYRAVIPTACWVIVGLLFFVLPQSREVLHGLCEPPLQSIHDLDDNTARLVNIWALLSYVITAVALALGTWYSARLLSTIEANGGTLGVFEAGHGMTRMAVAREWLPRILGVSVLVASVGAMTYANYTPQLTQFWALAVAGLGIGAPLFIALAYLAMKTPGQQRSYLLRVSGRVGLIAGLIGLVAAAVALQVNTEKWRVFAWCFFSSVLPALMLIGLVERRNWIKRRKDAGAVASASRRFDEAIGTVVILLLGSAVAMMVLALAPPPVVRGFGTGATVLLFLGAAVLLLTTLQLIVRRIARDVPGLTAAVVLVIAILVAAVGDESLGRERVKIEPQQAPVQPGATAAVLPSLASRPLYVNAYGGGLRAAAFTAEVLAQADDATCGKFGEQIAAFSGVSGGSLGIATYLIARQDLIARGGWKTCDMAAPSGSSELTDVVTRALVQDHLSSAIARMLAVDAPHLPWAPVRGQALLDSWQTALVSALSEARAGDGKPAGDEKPLGLALRLGDLTGGLPRPVDVYFNSTDADSGHIIWFSNREGGVVGRHVGKKKEVRVDEMTVGESVLHSARFPIVTPAGEYRLEWVRGIPARLVDGGYADNSGATTLLRALRDKAHGNAQQVWLLNIDGNQPAESLCVTTRGKPPVLTAVRALLQARSAHASLAVTRFVDAIKRDSQDSEIGIQFNLEKVYGVKSRDDTEACEKVRRARQAPLGWYMSYGAAQTIADSAGFGVADICRTIRMDCAALPRAHPAVH